MQLRMTLAELGMPSIPKLYAVPRVQSAFSEDGRPAHDKAYEFVKGFLNEMEWYAEALRDRRVRGRPGE
jgi:hypothetical protein